MLVERPALNFLFKYLLAILAAVSLAACQASDGSPGDGRETSSLAVEVAEAVPAEAYTIRRDYIGRVEARRASEVGFELGGELRAVAVEEGDEVAAGAELARLDTARLDAALAEARAALAEARSAAQLAERTLVRNAEAFEFEGVSAQELDLARDRAQSANARVAAAEARVNAVRVDIAKSTLVAPYAAVVVARRVDEGNIVGAGQPVLRLQEIAAPEVRVGVSGELAGVLEPGQARTLRIAQRDVAATVNAVLPLRDPRTRTVDVILALDASAGALPGDLARLVIDESIAEPGYWLPVAALAEGSRGLWTAYVITPIDDGATAATGATHRLEPRPVEILHQDGQDVFVRGALAAGDRYVTAGLQRVVPYQAVRVATANAMARQGQ